MIETISAARARRIALAAQGFGRPRPAGPASMRDLNRVIGQVAQFQIDSVNVLARAHYLPLFSRLGDYDTGLLERSFDRAPRRLFEYIGHEASLLDVELQPALRWRMRRAREGKPWLDDPELLAAVLDQIGREGPLTARQLDGAYAAERTHWGWNWSKVKVATEWLFRVGELSSAGRNPAFERRYDLPERVIPARVLQTPSPDDAEALRILVRRAARALGVFSVRCAAAYFRLPTAATATAIAELEASGELRPVQVPGWQTRLWLDVQARRPRSLQANALISPFDSLIFERVRALALFGLDYRIEIYVPAAKRRYGYYVYPFLRGDRFAARVDLKADRQSGVLLVQAAWIEAGQESQAAHVSQDLAAELARLATWLGLSQIQVMPRGDLASELSRAIG